MAKLLPLKFQCPSHRKTSNEIIVRIQGKLFSNEVFDGISILLIDERIKRDRNDSRLFLLNDSCL